MNINFMNEIGTAYLDGEKYSLYAELTDDGYLNRFIGLSKIGKKRRIPKSFILRQIRNCEKPITVNGASIKKKNITGGLRYSNHDNWKEEYVEFVYTESHLSEVLARLATTFKYISEINTSDTRK